MKGMTLLERPPSTTAASEPGEGSRKTRVRVVVAEAGAPGLRRALAELWRYRELLISMTLRDTRVRYRQSTLGPAWALLQPLALMVVFSLFLGRFAKMPSHGVPYPIFYSAALVPWSFLAAALPTAASSLILNSALINKVYFPREIFPIVGVAAAAADLGFASIGLAGMMVYYHTPLSACLLYLPVLFLGEFLLCLAAGLFLAGVSVYLRDIRHALPVMMQVWMYASPVVYSLDSVPQRFRLAYLVLNPMATYMDGYRRVILEGRAPQLPFLALTLLLSGLAFVLSYRTFKVMEQRCADTL
jgi:homopolymeric O-antigen transport system permease protein